MNTSEQGAAQQGYFGRHYILFILLIVYMVNFIDRMIVNVLVQPIKLDLQLTDTQMGLVTGFAFALLYGTMGLPFAWLAERYSRRNLIGITLAFWSLMTAACGVAQNFFQLFLARVGVGVGEAGCQPAAQSMISDLYGPERRASALAFYSMGSPLGSLFGALVGGLIAQQMGWRNAFFILGLPGVLLAIFFWLTVREPMRGAMDKFKVSDEAPSIKETLATLWRSPVYRHLTAGFGIASLSGYSITAFIVAYAQRQFDVTLMQASTAFGLTYGVTGAIGMLMGGLAADWAGKHDTRMYAWIPAFSLLLAGPIFMLALIQSDPKIMLLLSVIPALLFLVFNGPGYAMAHNIVQPRMRATATVVLLMSSSLIGLGIGPTATGAISDFSARHIYGADFDAVCRLGSSVEEACRTAEAQGLMYALIVAAALMIWAGAHFFMAGVRLRADLARLQKS